MTVLKNLEKGSKTVNSSRTVLKQPGLSPQLVSVIHRSVPVSDAQTIGVFNGFMQPCGGPLKSVRQGFPRAKACG